MSSLIASAVACATLAFSVQCLWAQTTLTQAIPSVAGSAAAHRYPERPIRLIVPNAPGGGTDILSRLIAQKTSESFGQQVVVDNRPGAGGIIGTDIAAKSAHDGYTLVMVFPAHATNVSMFRKLPFDPIKDFSAVTLLASNSYILVVHPSLPVKSVKDLIGLARARPGQLNYAAGRGTSPQLAAELFKSMAQVNITGIPYAGGGPSIAATLGGEVHMTYGVIAAVLPHVKSKKLTALAVTSAARSNIIPQLPTIAESGLPGYEAIAWYGLLAPVHTPTSIISKLDREFKRILQLPEVQERFAALGYEAIPSTPAKFMAFIELEMHKWAKVIKEAGISPL